MVELGSTEAAQRIDDTSVRKFGTGWLRIVDVVPQTGTVSGKTYIDGPNDTIIDTATASEPDVSVVVESSYPLIEVQGVPATLPKVGDIYRGTVNLTIAASGATTIRAQVLDPDEDVRGGADDSVVVTIDTAPELLTLAFTGGYPGSQTELKAGDTFQITGTTDKAADAIDILDFGACDASLELFGPGTAFTVTGTVANRGTSLQALAARVRARNAGGAFGATRDTDAGGGATDGVDLVNLNNLFPSVAIGVVTYPGGQQALKGAEAATVANTVSDFDVIAYDGAGASELAVSSPAVYEVSKSVSRIGGTYNVGVDNFRITATRSANDAVTIETDVVSIANVAAVVNVTEPAARLRSGGNNGTAAQDHEITVTADQELLSAPSLDPDAGGLRGAFIGGGFVGGPEVWTRDLRVDETAPDEKGVFTWANLSATNLAGIVTSSITGDATYELGGFVPRNLTFGPFATITSLDVEVADFSKLTAGVFTSTNNPALKQPIATPPSVTDGYTIDAVGVNPTDLIWLDSPAAASNSTGTARIDDVEETV